MKGSLIVVGFFALGCLLGWSGYLPGVVIENDITVYVLYLLMFQVGISIGSDKKLKEILSSIRPKLLLVPLATIIGTLSFSALISLALTKWSVFDCLAVGSGFAYYSLSSILITELKEPTLGAQLAAELGTIALIANIICEIFALLGAPLFVRYFGISDLRGRSYYDGYDIADHHPLLRKGFGLCLYLSRDLGGLHGSVFRFFLLFDVSERGFRDLGNHLARLKSHFRGLGRHFARLKSRFRGLGRHFTRLKSRF